MDNQRKESKIESLLSGISSTIRDEIKSDYEKKTIELIEKNRQNFESLSKKDPDLIIEGDFWDNFIQNVIVHDLSRDINEKPPCTADINSEPKIKEDRTGENDLFKYNIIDNLSTYYGTHIDFPGDIDLIIHNKKLISEYELKQHFISPAITIDISDIIAMHENYLTESLIDLNKFSPNSHEAIRYFFSYLSDNLQITPEIVVNKLKANKLELKQNYFLLFYTGLEKYWQYELIPQPWKNPYFLNPYITIKLAKYLCELGIKGVGIDSYSIESPFARISIDDPTFQAEREKLQEYHNIYSKPMAHYELLTQNIFIVENLVNLKKIVNKKVLFISLPLKLAICDQSSGIRSDDNSVTRAIALELYNLKFDGLLL